MAETNNDSPHVPSRLAPVLRHGYVAAVHLVLFVAAFWFAFGLRYEFHVPPFHDPIGPVGPVISPDDVGKTVSEFVPVPRNVWSAFDELLVFIVIVKLLVFGYFRLYTGWWQYVSVQDLVETFKASHISTAIILIGVYVTNALWGYGVLTPDAASPGEKLIPVPDTVLIIDWAATIALVGGMRFLVRIVREGSRPVSPAGLTRVLIVGAGNAGEGVLRELYRLPVERYHVVGFVDDDPRKRGIRIHGVPVLGDIGDLAEVAKKQNAEEVVIALPQPKRDELRRIIEVCKGQKLTFRIVPGVADLIEGRIDVSRLREVDINDLLGREPVSLNDEEIGSFLTGKIVLVTGAGGSIGSELCRQVAAFRPGRLVLLEQAENNLFHIDRELERSHPRLKRAAVVADVCDRQRLEGVFEEHGPNVVFHAAAHKHVPMMEINPGEAIKNNVFGTKNVADMACRFGSDGFVLISTDKAVNPTSIMGCTKRVAEMYCQALSASGKCETTKYVVVRFGNVLGSAGSVVPIFRDQIAKGGPVTVTHPEMRRYFMTIPEATQLVLQAGTMGQGGQTMLLDMGEPVKIVDLARDMITLSGYRPDEDIEIEFLGIRPGEKLFEELRTTGEDVLPTHHSKIFIWQSRIGIEGERMEQVLETLRAVCDGAEEEQVRAALKSVVPEYEPSESAHSPGRSSAATPHGADGGPRD